MYIPVTRSERTRIHGDLCFWPLCSLTLNIISLKFNSEMFVLKILLWSKVCVKISYDACNLDKPTSSPVLTSALCLWKYTFRHRWAKIKTRYIFFTKPVVLIEYIGFLAHYNVMIVLRFGNHIMQLNYMNMHFTSVLYL